jgi:hypothetical protein
MAKIGRSIEDRESTDIASNGLYSIHSQMCPRIDKCGIPRKIPFHAALARPRYGE